MVKPIRHYTDVSQVSWWNEFWESIVRSYPRDKQAQVRDDLLNKRNLEKYGVKTYESNYLYDPIHVHIYPGDDVL